MLLHLSLFSVVKQAHTLSERYWERALFGFLSSVSFAIYCSVRPPKGWSIFFIVILFFFLLARRIFSNDIWKSESTHFVCLSVNAAVDWCHCWYVGWKRVSVHFQICHKYYDTSGLTVVLHPRSCISNNNNKKLWPHKGHDESFLLTSKIALQITESSARRNVREREGAE